MTERRSRDILSWLIPAILGLGFVILLGSGVAADPARGVTASGSPFADEGFNSVNARNLVLLGRWSTDSWNLYLVNLPFSTMLAAVFRIFGVGIVQARLACVVTVGLLVALVGWGLRRPFGAGPASLAALALGTSGLVLYYGRLVYPEDLVAFFLATGVMTVGRDLSVRPWRWGLLGGALLALAIGTKPSAMFAVGGILVGVAVTGWRSPSARRWLATACLVILAAALGWVALIWLPQRSEVENVLRIWPQFIWPADPASLVRRVFAYVSNNDHALLLALPLAAAGLFGLALVISRWRGLFGARRLLLGAAGGWLVGGLGILALASYRPNRYVLPMLPAVAILAAAGFFFVEPWIRARLPDAGRVAALMACLLLLAAPGLVAYASWVVGAPSTAPAIQAEMAGLVPPGSVVVGVDSGLFMMRAPVVSIITAKGVPGNSGDLYHSAGARWYLTNVDQPPYAVSLPPGAWAARRRVACARWFGAVECLYQVP